MTFQIETGVPIPTRRGVYDFGLLTEAGQSAFIPCENRGKKAASIRASAARYTRETGIEFLVRAVEGGVRVWRLTPSDEQLAEAA